MCIEMNVISLSIMAVPYPYVLAMLLQESYVFEVSGSGKYAHEVRH